MTEVPLECSHLREIVNIHFKIDIMSKCQKKDYVDARMIYSKILIEKGYGPSVIGNILDKNHASIINYRKKVDWYLKSDKTLMASYRRCKDSFYMDYDPIYDLTNVELKHEILKLRDRLRIQVDKNNQLRIEKKRLEPLFRIVRERTKLNTEEEICKRLIRMFNGVYG